jgi:hypothetical protein
MLITNLAVSLFASAMLDIFENDCSESSGISQTVIKRLLFDFISLRQSQFRAIKVATVIFRDFGTQLDQMEPRERVEFYHLLGYIVGDAILKFLRERF